MSDRLVVNMVCTGNICRSPMAEYVARDLIEKAGLSDRIEVCSSGTDSYHNGEKADPRTIEVLKTVGIDASGHRSQKMTRKIADEADLILVATNGHKRSVQALGTDTPIHLIREWDNTLSKDDDKDLSDPWYGTYESFEICLNQVQRSLNHWFSDFREENGLS